MCGQTSTSPTAARNKAVNTDAIPITMLCTFMKCLSLEMQMGCQFHPDGTLLLPAKQMEFQQIKAGEPYRVSGRVNGAEPGRLRGTARLTLAAYFLPMQ